MPDVLRSSIESDLHPVRPLPSPWRRALLVVVVTGTVAALALAMIPVRSDMDQIPGWLGWGCSFLELAMGLFLVCLALREAVPGSGTPTGAATGFLAAGMLLQMLVGIATWLHSPGEQINGDGVARGVGCLMHDSTMALPTFVVTAWLIVRALPLRAPMAGMLGGAGAAISADAIIHLLCPFSSPAHVLVWHTGVIVLFMVLGWTAGKLWEALRWRRRA